MQENRLWGDKFRELFTQSKYGSLEKLANALSDVGFIKTSSDLSHWQHGRRILKNPQEHLKLIEALIKVEVIKNPDDANELQCLAGFRDLTDEELTALFSAAVRTTSESPEGAVRYNSPFYVERLADQIIKEEIKRGGVTITVKGPRSVGKSSLLMRIEAQAREAKKQVAIINFHDFEQSVLDDADLFFRQFCTLLTEELDIEDGVDIYWRQPLGNPQRCTRYMEQYLLKQLDYPLLLAMDAVDALFQASFSTPFFSMLRGWSDNRARPTKSIWKKLDIILVTSTEPYQLIKNLNLSPFNVGLMIELADFTIDQVSQLNALHGSPLIRDEVKRLWNLVAGHPYLVRQALYWVTGRAHSAKELFDLATEDYGSFGPHLQRHLRRLLDRPDQQAAFRQVIEGKKLSDEAMFLRLQSAGLIRREKGHVLPRCPLYASYFKERLYG